MSLLTRLTLLQRAAGAPLILGIPANPQLPKTSERSRDALVTAEDLARKGTVRIVDQGEANPRHTCALGAAPAQSELCRGHHPYSTVLCTLYSVLWTYPSVIHGAGATIQTPSVPAGHLDVHLTCCPSASNSLPRTTQLLLLHNRVHAQPTAGPVIELFCSILQTACTAPGTLVPAVRVPLASGELDCEGHSPRTPLSANLDLLSPLAVIAPRADGAPAPIGTVLETAKMTFLLYQRLGYRLFGPSTLRANETIPNQLPVDNNHRLLDTAADEFENLDNGWPSRATRLRNAETRASDFDDLDRSLDEANSHLRALLDLTTHNHLTPLMPPPFSPPLRSHDGPDDNRRSKRRKLDSERPVSSYKGIRYGQYGQVEPGQLQLEMVSCDGGMFSNETLYAAENILKDDNSVYCTKGNRCNIVLRHQGATVFTLSELVIKAPGSMNYSHPVREGMVFIAMEQDEVLSRTAQYAIQYPPRQRLAAHNQEDPQEPYSRDPRHIISIRHHDDGTTSRRATRTYIYRTNDDEEDGYRLAQMPEEFDSNQPDFRITTECSDAEDECDGPRGYRRTPNRIGSLPFEAPESDSDEPPPLASDDFLEELRHRHRDPASMSLTEAWEAHANATQEALRAVGGELLVPHAKFFIEKKKSKCTIKFDPPVSGRYILLKIWSSHHDSNSNIDIQSVMARGFAGPRYFPSVQLR
ncbi:hypothetical protein HJFPF1_03613 [Paramyrothecium foliicola]|nr:hypothetical protein HJFPF1_03613 [Paramyrothecium foliicola]